MRTLQTRTPADPVSSARVAISAAVGFTILVAVLHLLKAMVTWRE